MLAEGIARGDFEQTLDVRQNDEIGVLADAPRKTLDDLRRMIARRAADQGRAAAGHTSERATVVAAAGKANARVLGPTEAAEKIGAVARLIRSIAGQTNLLARNVGQAAAGTRQVSSNIDGVRETATEAGDDRPSAFSMFRTSRRENRGIYTV